MGNSPANPNNHYFYEMPIDLLCVIQVETRKIISANISFEYTLGWKTNEVLGNTLGAFVNTETDRENVEKMFSKVNLGVHSIAFETGLRAKNNLVRHIDWKGYIDSENGHIYIIGRDITPRKEAEKALSQQANIDPVTNIPNRQTFLTLLKNELSGAVRYHYATTIILIDIDNFKEFNEQNGIQKGDECLRYVASALRTCLRRKTDFLARFENDSFAVLLSHNDLEKGIKSAEYLRESLEKLANSNGNVETRHPISISLGVVAVPEDRESEISSETVLSAVKRALSISKQHGGNQVNYSEL